jgi:hypothetical protein
MLMNLVVATQATDEISMRLALPRKRFEPGTIAVRVSRFSALLSLLFADVTPLNRSRQFCTFCCQTLMNFSLLPVAGADVGRNLYILNAGEH